MEEVDIRPERVRKYTQNFPDSAHPAENIRPAGCDFRTPAAGPALRRTPPPARRAGIPAPVAPKRGSRKRMQINLLLHAAYAYLCTAKTTANDERETDPRHQRRRLRFERHPRRDRRGAPLRPGGGRGAGDRAERHEPGHYDVQPALSAPRVARGGGRCLRLLRHAGRLREDGFRLPDARPA